MGYCIEINLTFLGMEYVLLGFGLVREYWDGTWNLSFLEPSGPPQACNGTAVPFTQREERIINLKSMHQNVLYGTCNLRTTV
jgi:hypothetical protein